MSIFHTAHQDEPTVKPADDKPVANSDDTAKPAADETKPAAN